MDTGTLYIVITKDTGFATGQTGISGQSESQTKKEKKTFEEIADYQLFNFAKQEINKIINTTVSNIGNFTGDYYDQRDAQTVLEWVNGGLNILNSGVSLGKIGASVGGASGAIGGFSLGAGLAVAGIAINTGLTYISNTMGRIKQNIELDRIRDISGFNVLTNGSR